ncbi:sodium-dependent serotonin transporter-like protein [Dinothrombium tinctorium]|uniref:Sodium-dependent serotonin transporter-like protein n=1 Tax=Dinothrombium tinctorium TaxID=1965070 RepID=A0A443QEK7_9ACAR|nr:sodium-dependent serotonin transporter-like protein [Dinothrombium tinctorium]
MIFTGAVIQHKDLEWQGYQYPQWSVIIGWCLTFSSLLCVPIYAVYCFAVTKGTFKEVLIRKLIRMLFLSKILKYFCFLLSPLCFQITANRENNSSHKRNGW